MAVALACSKPASRNDVAAATGEGGTPPSPPRAPDTAPAALHAIEARGDSSVTVKACGNGRRLTVHFYDVGEALAALVDLPDGRHVLVDTGDGPRRAGCGDSCGVADRHFMQQLKTDLDGAKIDLLWITHQHADHIGGAPEVLDAFRTGIYVDNGREANKPEVRRAHDVAQSRGIPLYVVDPEHTAPPALSASASQDIKLTPIVPYHWPPSCAHDPNECSIALRLDFCSSSVLFTGDAEHDEEAMLDPRGPVTLLQVAHHGSETSSSPAFLAKVRPRYAVISAGKPGEGHNRSYCHPRALVVKRLTRVLGAPAGRELAAFDGDRCDRATDSDWATVSASDVLWATERDGDVVLTTTGDGSFRREGK